MSRGQKTRKTIDKELAREATRAVLQKHFDRMLRAQVEAACGLGHLMLRNDDGTWRKAPEDMTADEMLAVLNGDQTLFMISPKDPSTQAFNTLAAYYLDKPKDQPQEVAVTGRLTLEQLVLASTDHGGDGS